jgi:hypothetical protein
LRVLFNVPAGTLARKHFGKGPSRGTTSELAATEGIQQPQRKPIGFMFLQEHFELDSINFAEVFLQEHSSFCQ